MAGIEKCCEGDGLKGPTLEYVPGIVSIHICLFV